MLLNGDGWKVGKKTAAKNRNNELFGRVLQKVAAHAQFFQFMPFIHIHLQSSHLWQSCRFHSRSVRQQFMVSTAPTPALAPGEALPFPIW